MARVNYGDLDFDERDLSSGSSSGGGPAIPVPHQTSLFDHILNGLEAIIGLTFVSGGVGLVAGACVGHAGSGAYIGAGIGALLGVSYTYLDIQEHFAETQQQEEER